LKEEEWIKEEEEFKKTRHTMHLKTIGFKVFEIERRVKVKQIDNDYEKASKKYIKDCRKVKGNTLSYNMINMDINVKFWNNKEWNYPAHVVMSQNIYDKIRELRIQLKHYKFEIGKYVIYWKRDKMRVWVACMTEKQYNAMKGFLLDFDYKNSEHYNKLVDDIAWTGNGAWCPYSKLKRWYGGKDEKDNIKFD